MEWMTRMNAALDYIESRLTEEISYAEAAKKACCPAQHFQRMFAFVTDIPLSEYIRRRRLTLAAFELQHSPSKIVDIALKFGYESPEAFARAFQQLHGTTPTQARSIGTTLKAYPRITFQFILKGAAEMNYRMEKARAFRVAGEAVKVDTERAFEQIPLRWSEAAEDGLFGRLFEIGRFDAPIRGLLGVLAEGKWGQAETFDYHFAIASDAPLPEGMAELVFPEALWAVFSVQGSPDGLQEAWKRLYTEWLPSSSYELANLPAVEAYLPPEEECNELWIPVIPKS